MRLCLFFLPNFPRATFIQGATCIPDSRVVCERMTRNRRKMVIFKVTTHLGDSDFRNHDDQIFLNCNENKS